MNLRKFFVLFLFFTSFFTLTQLIATSDSKAGAASVNFCRANGYVAGTGTDVDNDDWSDFYECFNYDLTAVVECSIPTQRCSGDKIARCKVINYGISPSNASSAIEIWSHSNTTFVYTELWPDEFPVDSGSLLGNIAYAPTSYCTGGGSSASTPTISCAPNSQTSPATFTYRYSNAPAGSRVTWGIGSAAVSGSGSGSAGPISASNSMTVTFRLGSATAACSVSVGSNPPPPPGLTWGCTDPSANNYSVSAVVDDGSCLYTVAPTVGSITLRCSTDFADGRLSIPVTGLNTGQFGQLNRNGSIVGLQYVNPSQITFLVLWDDYQIGDEFYVDSSAGKSNTLTITEKCPRQTNPGYSVFCTPSTITLSGLWIPGADVPIHEMYSADGKPYSPPWGYRLLSPQPAANSRGGFSYTYDLPISSPTMVLRGPTTWYMRLFKSGTNSVDSSASYKGYPVDCQTPPAAATCTASSITTIQDKNIRTTVSVRNPNNTALNITGLQLTINGSSTSVNPLPASIAANGTRTYGHSFTPNSANGYAPGSTHGIRWAVTAGGNTTACDGTLTIQELYIS